MELWNLLSEKMKKMKNYKVAIVGGGPAGMIAAISAAKEIKTPYKVVLIEKNEKLGKKLLLTGGGRCNITNLSPIKKLINQFRKEDKLFLKHSIYNLNNHDLLNIFRNKGLEFKEEENGRCFPTTEDSNSVLSILKEYLEELNIEVLLNFHVKSIIKKENERLKIKLNEKVNETIEEKNNLFRISTNKKDIFCEKVILATGGKSYPHTGSNGEGYNLATKFGHSISQLMPGATPLEINDPYLNKLSGITLENVEISYKINNNQAIEKCKVVKVRGNILITHSGLSGPGILDISNHISLDNQCEYSKLTLNGVYIEIDLIPNINEEKLNEMIIKDSSTNGKTMIKNYLKIYLKNRFIDFFLNKSQVSGNKTLSNMTKKDKKAIINALKHFKVEINSMNKKASMITCGGVKINEINPKTMESKISGVNGLYFAGELLESYGSTGGYNLQIAFSTGYLAGKSAGESVIQ